MYALINGQIYTGNKILNDHAVVISRGIIVDICPIKELSTKIIRYDLHGNKLSPGFIDLQINGCGGVQFNDKRRNLSVDTLKTMQKTNQKFGCTSFLPTLVSSSDSFIFKAVEIMRIFLKKYQNQALGLHLEGPYINVQKKGIHNSIFIRSPSRNMVRYLCKNGDIIRKITLAPEVVEKSVIQQFYQSGICLSVGHSNATYKQAMRGFNNGINFATHIFNAMPPLMGREPGVIGAVFDNPHIYCSIIADGKHVSWANIRNTKKIKGDHLILISDATLPTGTVNIKSFNFYGKKIVCNNSICIDKHGTFGGSNLTMIKAIKNIVQYTHITLEEALRMATLYPARALGIDDKLGSLAINKVANLTAFTKKYIITKTIVNGKEVN